MKKFNQTLDYYNLKQEILLENRFCCSNCGGQEDLEIDHRKAICLGGSKLNKENLQVLCKECHYKKSQKDILLFKKFRRLLRNGDIYAI